MVTVGETIKVLPILPPGNQVYVPPPLAVNVSLFPIQIAVLLAEIVTLHAFDTFNPAIKRRKIVKYNFISNI